MPHEEPTRARRAGGAGWPWSPGRATRWRAVVAVASAGLGERAIGDWTPPRPSPLRGMGGSRSPSPERAYGDRRAIVARPGLHGHPAPPARRGLGFVQPHTLEAVEQRR